MRAALILAAVLLALWQRLKQIQGGEEDAALPETAGSWQQAADGIRWWWRNPNGSFPAGEWMKINGEWYYFDEEGYWEMKEAGQS